MPNAMLFGIQSQQLKLATLLPENEPGQMQATASPTWHGAPTTHALSPALRASRLKGAPCRTGGPASGRAMRASSNNYHASACALLGMEGKSKIGMHAAQDLHQHATRCETPTAIHLYHCSITASATRHCTRPHANHTHPTFSSASVAQEITALQVLAC